MVEEFVSIFQRDLCDPCAASCFAFLQIQVQSRKFICASVLNLQMIAEFRQLIPQKHSIDHFSLKHEILRMMFSVNVASYTLK